MMNVRSKHHKNATKVLVWKKSRRKIHRHQWFFFPVNRMRYPYTSKKLNPKLEGFNFSGEKTPLKFTSEFWPSRMMGLEDQFFLLRYGPFVGSTFVHFFVFLGGVPSFLPFSALSRFLFCNQTHKIP